jgi:hypothetical protein
LAVDSFFLGAVFLLVAVAMSSSSSSTLVGLNESII